MRQHGVVPVGEERLEGGNTSLVVRVGDTVRRSAGSWTPVVQELLRHVRVRGFDLAPEPLGFDDAGREVLRFIPGEAVGSGHPWPAWAWSDDLLVETARAARCYHEAVASFRPPGAVAWRAGTGSLAHGEIVCHNDFAPYNVVTSRGRLRGVIDWDFAAPGTPLWEVAFMAWQWAPLHHPALAESLGAQPDAVARRVQLLCDAYGLADRSGLVDAIIRRVDASRRGILDGASAGDETFLELEAAGHAGDMAKTLHHLEQVGHQLHPR